MNGVLPKYSEDSESVTSDLGSSTNPTPSSSRALTPVDHVNAEEDDPATMNTNGDPLVTQAIKSKHTPAGHSSIISAISVKGC